MDLAFQKTRARVQAKAKRQAFLRAENAQAAAIALIEHFPAVQFRGASIGGVWPLPGEVDVRSLMAALAEQGHPLSLPCTPRKGRPLTFRRWTHNDPLKAGPYGTREPYPEKPEVSPTLVLVPLLAFNQLGERLGYGGGFYDRTLAELRAKHRLAQTNFFACGVALAAQETALIPTGEHDVPLDGILTDKYFKAF